MQSRLGCWHTPAFRMGVLLHHALLQEVQGSDLGCSRPQVGHWPGLGSESELRLWTVVATRKSPIEVYNNGTYIGPFGRGILELISPLSSTIHPSLPPSLRPSIHACTHHHHHHHHHHPRPSFRSLSQSFLRLCSPSLSSPAPPRIVTVTNRGTVGAMAKTETWRAVVRRAQKGLQSPSGSVEGEEMDFLEEPARCCHRCIQA